jgi:hypothetical protein
VYLIISLLEWSTFLLRNPNAQIQFILFGREFGPNNSNNTTNNPNDNIELPAYQSEPPAYKPTASIINPEIVRSTEEGATNSQNNNQNRNSNEYTTVDVTVPRNNTDDESNPRNPLINTQPPPAFSTIDRNNQR